jgi:DNA-directed RNA polymerase subunit F
MIKNTTPLSMPEAEEYLGDKKENEIELGKFIKRFVKLDVSDAKKMRKKLEDLGMIKMKEEQIVKIIDFMPEDSEGLNKIFTDVSLDEDETKKILDTISEFK